MRKAGRTFFWSSMSSFLLELITGQEELNECSKLTCFAKRIVNRIPRQGDWWLMPAAVRHRLRICEVESDLGKGKIDPVWRIQTQKKKKRSSLIHIHESQFTNEFQSRTEALEFDRRPAERTAVYAYIHACICAAALHAYAHLLCTRAPRENKETNWMIEYQKKKELAGYYEANDKVVHVAFVLIEGYLCPLCPAATSTRSLSLVICDLSSLEWERRIEGRLK